MIGVHVRLLLTIPLFFLCETWVAPLMTEFVRGLVRSHVIPDAALPTLADEVRRVNRLKDAWVAELLFFLLAFAAPLVNIFIAFLPGRTASLDSLLAVSGDNVGPVLAWYLGICLPLFRFLVLRWLWHLGLWCYFLWRLQRIDLRLIPTHPDHAAGLGFLEVVQEHFTYGVLAPGAPGRARGSCRSPWMQTRHQRRARRSTLRQIRGSARLRV